MGRILRYTRSYHIEFSSEPILYEDKIFGQLTNDINNRKTIYAFGRARVLLFRR